jgi:hypothetical protein
MDVDELKGNGKEQKWGQKKSPRPMVARVR